MDQSTPRRSSRRRWLWRLVMGLGLLLLLIVVVVQIFLWTDYPRRIAVAEIQKRLGLQATIGSVSISWLGHTRVHDLSLAVPMSDGPLLEVKALDLWHTSLPLIAFSQSVDQVSADGVDLYLRQQSDGKWNIQQLATGRNTEPAKSTGSLDLPDVTARQVQLHVYKRDGSETDLKDVSIDGVQSAALEYALKLNIGQSLRIEGKTALAKDFHHEVRISLTGLPEGIQKLLPAAPKSSAAEIRWTGRAAPDGVTGVLEVQTSAVAGAQAFGQGVIYTTAENEIVFEPRGFSVEPEKAGPPALRLTDGRIKIGKRIRIDRLRGNLGQGTVAADGFFEPANFSGELQAAWEQVSQRDILSSGRMTLSTHRDFTGRQIAQSTIHASLATPAGRTSGDIDIHLEMNPSRDVTGTIKAAPLDWTTISNRRIPVPAMEASLQSAGSILRLQTLKLVDSSLGRLLATGELDLKSHAWWASIDAAGLNVSNSLRELPLPVDLDVSAHGSFARAELGRVYFKTGRTVLWTDGFYDSSFPKPVNLNAWLWYAPSPDDEADADFSGMQAQAAILGTLHPRVLHAEGLVSANELSIAGVKIGDVAINLLADLSDERAKIRSREIELLGATWTLRGDWHAFSGDPLTVIATWQHLPLQRIGTLLQRPGLRGAIDTGEATLLLPSARLKEIELDATTQAGPVGFGAIDADSAVFTARLRGGALAATAKFQRGKGSIDTVVSLNLPRVPQIKATATIDQWPAPTLNQKPWLASLTATLSGRGGATYWRETHSFQGNAELTGRMDREGKTVGDVQFVAKAQDQLLSVEQASINTLGGRATLTGELDLADPNTAQFDLLFHQLAPAELAWIRPELGGVSGTITGSLLIHPSPFARDLGPLEILLTLRPENAGFRSIPLGPINLAAYAEYVSPQDFRLVTDRAQIDLAGGSIKPFVRLSSTPHRGLAQLLTATLKDLNLEPIVKAFRDDGKPVVGIVSGEVRIYGAARSLGEITAEANLQVYDSDLVNFGPIAALYNVMRAGAGGQKPQGTGNVSLRLEQARLNIVNASYFNRGIFASAYGGIDGLDNGMAAKNDYTVLGSVRLLKDINLPGFADADKILSAFQSSVTAVYVDGTLDKIRAKQVALSELGASLRAIVLGKVREREN